MPSTRLARFAWGVLVYNLGVILWGAFVRATGNGAGCGSHWPTCNGEVIPRAPELKTLIEFTHRATSGLALISVVILAIWIFRTQPRGHVTRQGAAASVFFMLTEAAVGAGLVLFELVAENKSMARAYFMAVHLVNTFLLVAAMTLTAWWTSGGKALQLRGQGSRMVLLGGAFLLMMLLGVSGAITALGDTLFPARSLTEGLAQDFSPTAHIFLRLRIFHPAIAIVTALYLVVMVAVINGRSAPKTAERLGRGVIAVVAVQMLAGLLNVALLAPVWLQLVHLLLADLVWIGTVLLGASVLAASDVTEPTAMVAAAESRAA